MNFSLYRGNLHKVPDVPRRWPLAKPSMSLQVFQKAVAKRHEALNRDHQNLKDEGDSMPDAAQLQLEADVEESADPLHREDLETSCNGDYVIPHEEEYFRKRKRDDASLCDTLDMERNDEEIFLEKRKNNAVTDGDGTAEFHTGTSDTSHHTQDVGNVHILGDNGVDTVVENVRSFKDEGIKDRETEKLEAPQTAGEKSQETENLTKPVDTGYDSCSHPCSLMEETLLEKWKAEKKVELQEKLKQLQDTKHQLVQILKQVLISEEESKRKVQGFPQYSMMHSTLGLMDLPTDHRLGSDMHMGTDLEEGEFECMNNHPSPIIASNLGSNFSVANHQQLSATVGRYYSFSQPLNKP